MEKESMFYRGNPKIGADPRLISIPNLCEMHRAFSFELVRLQSDDPDDSSVELLNDGIQLVIGILFSRLNDCCDAEYEAGNPSFCLKNGQEET